MAVATSETVTPRVTAALDGRSVARAANSRIYLPALALAAAAVAFVTYGVATGFGGALFFSALRSSQLQDMGTAALVVLGAILVAERVRPAQRRSLVSRGARHDVLYALMHLSIGAMLATALSLSLQEGLRSVVPWLILPKMSVAPHLVVVVVIYAAMDGLLWLGHLLDHRWRVLWRFHEVHHSQEDLNALTVFRTHPFVAVSYMPSILPAFVLLANGGLSLTILVVYAGIVAFAHSNTNLSFGPLGRLVVSPNYHRLHHRLAGAQDVNLGFTLTIWDQLAGLALFPNADTVRIDTGIPGRPLRVEQQGERPRHLATFWAQMVGPFRPMPTPVELPSHRQEASHRRVSDEREVVQV